MTDISLIDITSGYNFVNVNANFTTLETVVNDEVLHTIGGNNSMNQQLDMNSNRIINSPDAIADSDLVTLGQARGLSVGGSPGTPSGDGDSDRDLDEDCLNKFCVLRLTSDRVYTLTAGVAEPGNYYIFRNSSSSAGTCTLVAGTNTDIDVSADLGLIIPAGGIAELYYHDDNAGTERWHMFGYIRG